MQLTFASALLALSLAALATPAAAQLTDVTQTPNTVNAGIKKSFPQEIGAGRGDLYTPDSSLYLIGRDPFRSIARGRQLFQRKFTAAQGLGPRRADGIGDIGLEAAIGAGLADSCAACHSRPFGSAGIGGNVFTRPESRDAPHLFGLGLVEMLGDEITQDLRAIRANALAQAQAQGVPVTLALLSKQIHYGAITANPDGTFDTSQVVGVDPDLRVRPFFAQGKTISIREFVVGALNAEMGLQAADPDLLYAASGFDVTTPSGMTLSGLVDAIEAPPASSPTDDPDLDGVLDEVPESAVDALEFYLLNYFKPGTGPVTEQTQHGMELFRRIGCAQCHVPNLRIDHDRRVADVQTAYDDVNSNRVFNHLYATAATQHDLIDDGSGYPPLKPAIGGSFVVQSIFADFRRHDLGQGFHERNFDGSIQTHFMTEPLWGVASTAPYGHDGRSATLTDVILRHGGDAQVASTRFQELSADDQGAILAMLGRLVLFSPPDTASNLDPANAGNPQYPLYGHGSIDLSVLFVVPSDKE